MGKRAFWYYCLKSWCFWNNLSKEIILSLLNQAILNYNPNLYDPIIFRQIANGFFQAEGCITARFTGLFKISPVLVLTHNLFPESLNFFVWLWNDLGKIGNLNITRSSNGQWVISLRSESWNDILNIYAQYFNLVYGEKYVGFLVLKLIKELINKINKINIKWNENLKNWLNWRNFVEEISLKKNEIKKKKRIVKIVFFNFNFDSDLLIHLFYLFKNEEFTLIRTNWIDW